MQNKLDPRQYTPYALDTPSGNLSFSRQATSFDCYLNERLTGNFNITGSLRVNNGLVFSSDLSNTFGGSGIAIFNSINCYATGQNNTIVGSNLSELSGQNNSIFGGENNQISSSQYGTILGGRNVLLSHTGATILGDGDNSRIKRSVQHNSLTIDFSSGFFIQNNTFINGSLSVTGGNTVLNGFSVPSSNSGLLSGNLNILGTPFHTGSPLQNLQNLRDCSGTLQTFSTTASGSLRSLVTGMSGAFDTKIALTGSSSISYANSLSGTLSSDYNTKFTNTLQLTGNQTINGRKFFNEGAFFNFVSGNDIQSTGRFILGRGRFVPTAFNSIGTSGQLSWDGRYLFLCTGNSAWARIWITGW
jgi:hypothetical protein